MDKTTFLIIDVKWMPVDAEIFWFFDSNDFVSVRKFFLLPSVYLFRLFLVFQFFGKEVGSEEWDLIFSKIRKFYISYLGFFQKLEYSPYYFGGFILGFCFLKN